MELICGKPTFSFKHLEEFLGMTIEHYRRKNTNFGIYRCWELDPHQITLTYPQTIYGTFPEPFRKIHQNMIPDTIRNTYGHC